MKNNGKDTRKKGIILILTYENDKTTSDVIDWLLKKGEKVFRINEDHLIEIEKVTVYNRSLNLHFKCKGQRMTINNIKSFWYRRGLIRTDTKDINTTKSEIKFYLEEEKRALLNFFSNQLDKKARVNHILFNEINKLFQLKAALECGLKIPDTIITKRNKDVSKFISQKKKIITKSIQSSVEFIKGKYISTLLTNEFTSADLQKNSEIFFYTKFQNQIEKEYELRIFYLNGSFYPMAIFSQTNPNTRVDFRNYDLKVPNRYVPFILPDLIKKNLKNLMLQLKLISGSIDMIVDKKNQFFFLEVNPVGQFGMVSYPCNYNLEEKIAAILSK